MTPKRSDVIGVFTFHLFTSMTNYFVYKFKFHEAEVDSFQIYFFLIIFLLSFALLLSASSIDQDEASKLVEEVAMEVKAEGTASSKNSNRPSTSKPSSATTSKKEPNLKVGSSKSAAFPKVNGRTRMQRSNTAPGVSGVRPNVSRENPVPGRRNPSTVSI